MLRKFPWQVLGSITILERWQIFNVTFMLLDHLQIRIAKNVDEVRLTKQLLKRVTDTAMGCPGFTVYQKSQIADLVGMTEAEAMGKYGLPSNAEGWLHQYAIVPKPGTPRDVIEVGRKIPLRG
jgi:hypothetical protein